MGTGLVGERDETTRPRQQQRIGNVRARTVLPRSKEEEAPTLEQIRGEASRAAIDAIHAVREVLRCGDGSVIKAVAIAAGILTDKAIVLDVRVQARRPDLTPQQIDDMRAQQQAIQEEIARRKAEALKRGQLDGPVDVTPQLLDAMEQDTSDAAESDALELGLARS